jgi:hypothetical protein
MRVIAGSFAVIREVEGLSRNPSRGLLHPCEPDG